MTVITLTTDFGTEGGFVATMKGVILGINPDVRIIDITHEIRPQNIAEASFVLATTYKYFPAGTIHLAVVDPRVGTKRRAIVLKARSYYFIGPDNGLFTHPLLDFYPDKLDIATGKIKLPAGITAINLTNRKFWHKPLGNTFHGRDIFAPVAAYLSRGIRLNELGEAVDEIAVLAGYEPVEIHGGLIIGHVIYIDHFGNIITDIKESDLRRQRISSGVEIAIKGQTISDLVRTYAEGKGPVALFGSSGYLEIALANDNAAAFIKASVGDKVEVRAA